MKPIPWTPDPARDLGGHQPIPVGEMVELPLDDGWRQWLAAVLLQDSLQAPVGRWALEPAA